MYSDATYIAISDATYIAISDATYAARRLIAFAAISDAPVQLQTKEVWEYDEVLEPSEKFMERHQLLLANSVAHCSGKNTVVQILNPTLQPIVLHMHEVVGHFQPLSEEDQVCILGDSTKVPKHKWRRK